MSNVTETPANKAPVTSPLSAAFRTSPNKYAVWSFAELFFLIIAKFLLQNVFPKINYFALNNLPIDSAQLSL